ncbi:uncharacterized protein [Temnothorax nylanderi]|uniref:uncharacterized protein n=1 Tax=Temnothorax nylanderi TaxID=102681 RepID=UPI003A878A69
MSSVEELLVMQDQYMNAVSRALPNFEKLGQSKMTPAVTRQRLSTLKEMFAKCQELHAKISFLAEEKLRNSHLYFTQNYFIACEDYYNEAADYMSDVLASHDDHPFGTLRDGSSLSDPFRATTHLPRISLPTFDGSTDKWESFRDRFKSLVYSEPNLSNVDRMHYLCSCVKGEASKALDHLAVTEQNFEVAWNILVSRYDNKRRLITVHLQNLFNLPSLTAETSKDLRNLRDQTNTAIQALKNLGREVEHWDDLLVFLVAQNLDQSSRKAWELKLGDTIDYPRYRELDQFLESRIRALEILPPPKEKPGESSKKKSLASHSASAVPLACSICKANHLLYQCPAFLKQTPFQRSDFIRKNKRCLNCFSTKHHVIECTSSYVCRHCQKRHHSLLHFENIAKPVETESPPVSTLAHTENKTNEVAAHLISKTVAPNSKILLATARVRVHSSSGRFVTVRALLDQGSVSTLMTESLAQCLRLPKLRRAVFVTGIGETQSVVRHAAHITITPASHDGPAYSTTALILPSLTKYIPSRVETACQWKHITGLNLADSEPMSSDPIDVIIGADLFGMLVLDGVRKGSIHEPTAQNTTLGWIISGPIAPPPTREPSSVSVFHGDLYEALDFDIRRFWEVEEIPQKAHLSPEERQCEEHFMATHSRTPQGRYVVRLLFKTGPPIPLGESRAIALSRFHQLERRLQRDPSQASAYREFLAEYELLGHMIEVSPNKAAPPQSYYIPHHAVSRADSATTRLRVVFNASSPTTNGTSLNSHMLIEPKLQQELPTVIILFRQHRYVYTADIGKMYRQILIDDRDITYQRIFWRPSPDEPLKEYILVTVTYGTAAAPYLALRVLEQLATDHGAEFPLAILVLRRKTYVDDTAFGADDPILARQTRDQLIAILNKGGFRLRKWASNSSDLLSDIDPSDHGLATHKVLQDDEQIKVLGIIWNPSLDVFQFRVSVPSAPMKTKQTTLSTIAKFFDPLGWATPVIITAKIFMQQLWLL